MAEQERYRNRYRGERSRGRAGHTEPSGDAVVVALTTQVLICIVLLLAANLMKRTGSEGFDNVYRQYHVMVTDSAQTEQAVDYLTGGQNPLTRFFAAVENAVRSLTEALGYAAPPPQQESGPQEEQSETAGYVFDYDYIDPDRLSYASLGQGGAFPVSLDLRPGEALPAPEGSVFSPVYLTGRMKPPVTGLVTSSFSYREHPVWGKEDFHTGMDIASPEGTAILAALPGEVTETGESEIYGIYMKIRHGANLETFYAHCSELIAAQGMRVRQGERIARVGQTGTATGPHLHFSVIVDGQYTDPYWVLQDNIQLVE